jgi:Fe-S cluster assembly protein SufD
LAILTARLFSTIPTAQLVNYKSVLWLIKLIPYLTVKSFVAKAAQLTDAGQLNRNLLLSPKARVDTKPQLEIIADNVKCTHGATVSQLDDEEVFYLQSRGLDKVSANNLLVDAFAIEIINQIPIASLQTSLSQCVACRTVQ